MLGVFSLSNDNEIKLKKDQLFFVHIPDDLPKEEIKERLAAKAQLFANTIDAQKVYLLYGKDNYIEYEYSI